MNKFIKNVCSAIAIACGTAVFVGGDYCAYASQIETTTVENSLQKALEEDGELPDVNRLADLQYGVLVEYIQNFLSLNSRDRKQIK